MQENADQNNPEYGNFLRSVIFICSFFLHFGARTKTAFESLKEHYTINEATEEYKSVWYLKKSS